MKGIRPGICLAAALRPFTDSDGAPRDGAILVPGTRSASDMVGKNVARVVMPGGQTTPPIKASPTVVQGAFWMPCASGPGVDHEAAGGVPAAWRIGCAVGDDSRSQRL